jgi:hypothetical protein
MTVVQAAGQALTSIDSQTVADMVNDGILGAQAAGKNVFTFQVQDLQQTTPGPGQTTVSFVTIATVIIARILT